MANQVSSSCSRYSLDKDLEEFPRLSLSDTHRQQRLITPSVCGPTSKPFEEKSLDSFVPKSESEFVEYAELISRKLRSFEKNHHNVAFLKAINELTLGPLNAADAEEVASSLSVIAHKKRKSQEDANAGKQNTDTHKKKHLHMDKLFKSSVFNRLAFWRRRKPFETLSVNLLFEILTRIAAEDVLRCRLVCRKWREVTSTPCFIAKHAERAPKILIIHESESEAPGLFFVFGEFKKKSSIDEVETRYFVSNNLHSKSIQVCNGLVLQTVQDDNSYFSICNPFTGEELVERIPRDVATIYGFFFHPDKGDYRVLCGRREVDSYVFKIFNLHTRSWGRLNKTFSSAPDPRVSHVMSNRILHWKAVWKVGHDCVPCKEFIMTFNIYTEEFASRSHPGEEGCSKEMHKKMHLMEGEGETLSFAQMVFDTMIIWSLEDYGRWGWERKYHIHLRWNDIEKPFTHDRERVRPICIQGDQLLLIWDLGRVFLYNLRRGTLKEVKIRWQELNTPGSFGGNYILQTAFYETLPVYASSYRKTFVSLEGAKRNKIHLDLKLTWGYGNKSCDYSVEGLNYF